MLRDKDGDIKSKKGVLTLFTDVADTGIDLEAKLRADGQADAGPP